METVNSPLLARGVAFPPGGESAIAEAEVRALVETGLARGAQSIAIGSGRDPISRASAQTIADAWRRTGGEVGLELDWPETAASWLRPATRFATANADLWIMLGPPLGWAQMTRRLLWSTSWRPARALLAGSVSDPGTLDLVGLINLSGIAGTTSDGGDWHLSAGDRIITNPRDES